MRKNCTSLFIFLLMMVFSCSVFAAQAQPQQAQTAAQNTVKRWLLINVPARSLRVYDNDRCIAMYPVGVGKINSKTPAGYYKVVEKIVNPTWIDPSDTSIVIPSGPDNPLGYRWIGIGGNYGIHGTNRPDTVGHYVSNGCVRMVEASVEKVFDMVNVGTEVQIAYNRLVIDKTPDNRIAYYIYPDGYNMQNVTVDFVKQGLAGYGIADFVSSEDVQKSIDASSGQPNYVAAPINIMINGTRAPFKAVNYQNLIYVPVKSLAAQLQTNINISQADSMVTNDKGSANIVFYSNNPYIRLTDLTKVFAVDYTLNDKYTVLTLTPAKDKVEVPTAQNDKAVKGNGKTVEQKAVKAAENAEAGKNTAKAAPTKLDNKAAAAKTVKTAK